MAFFVPPAAPLCYTENKKRFLEPLPLKAIVPTTSRTRKIVICGMVQGVGFRPHLYRLAKAHGLYGEVANNLAGVELVLEGDNHKINILLAALQQNPPPGAVIISIENEEIREPRLYHDFTISPSLSCGGTAPLAPADFAMCAACEQELTDPANRRFQHPFISCTACGPRFSLIDGLPYDRPLTSMAEFPLCPACHREYTDPTDRRFHAEPICCPACGPQLTLYQPHRNATEQAVRKTAALLAAGCLVAIKGVGGFHLAADAGQARAVGRLRAAKQRPDKPLAVMVRDLATAARLAHITPAAAALLSSPARPVVIMPARETNPATALAAPGLSEIGVMLAYTPLHYLLFDHGPPVLIMTSLNEPESPMLTSTTEALERLGPDCDAVLSHNRRIRHRCDDSVLRMHGDEPRFIRRSRGYAPLPLDLGADHPDMLACGAGEKITICLSRGHLAFFSQHLGSTLSPSGQGHYKQATTHLQELLRITPSLVAHDLHPDYFSSRYALAQSGVTRMAIQHHHAHIAACMAEHNIVNAVIGLALDGTGLGTDGNLWGGEILRCTRREFQRLAHLEYLALPGGAQAIKEPWRLALAWLHRENLLPRGLAFFDQIPNNTKAMVIEMLDRELHCPQSSSLGRLFDATAALINLRRSTTFAAQAAMELEALADPHEFGCYLDVEPTRQGTGPWVMATGPLLQAMLTDLENGTGPAIIAARFHNTVISMLSRTCLDLCQRENIFEVACSGGVFQNRLISLGLERRLTTAGITLYSHQQIPCNDGGLALGQLAVAAARYRHPTGERDA